MRLPDILESVHSGLENFHPKRELQREVPEQIAACLFIAPDDCVLELGGSIGRNSCVINSKLRDKSKHLVVEPSEMELEMLYQNRDNNNLKFQILEGVISNKQMYTRGWMTYDRKVIGSKDVDCYTWEQVKEKFNLDFTAMVVDNEGNFCDMLRAFPDMLNGIRTFIIEHDFKNPHDYEYFLDEMLSRDFTVKYVYNKIDTFGPGMDWPDGLPNDPVFVSVWTK
jgi:hypothetical protein